MSSFTILIKGVCYLLTLTPFFVYIFYKTKKYKSILKDKDQRIVDLKNDLIILNEELLKVEHPPSNYLETNIPSVPYKKYEELYSELEENSYKKALEILKEDLKKTKEYNKIVFPYNGTIRTHLFSENTFIRIDVIKDDINITTNIMLIMNSVVVSTLESFITPYMTLDIEEYDKKLKFLYMKCIDYIGSKIILKKNL